jgi:hypothetical protein
MVQLIVAPCFSAGEAVGGEPHNNTMKPKFSLHKHGLRVDFDAAEIFPEDPGAGTPVMVYTCGNSATYNCARNEGEVDTVRLTQTQIDWLWQIEEEVWDWFEKHTLAGPCA